MTKTKLLVSSILALSFAAPAMAADYVVMANYKNFSAKKIAKVEALGATVKSTLPQVGMIFVESDDPDFRAKASAINGVRSAFADLSADAIAPVGMEDLDAEAMAVYPPFTGDDDAFLDLQWGHTAVQAIDAWDAGFRGTGVRVAVLDSGIDSTHPDLSPNLDVGLSTSFVPGESFDMPAGDHGSHVAGTIAAADNAFGSVGIAPEAEIVSVKVLSAVSGSGSTSGILSGIVYAADIDADVINMSLGYTGGIPRNCTFGEDHFPAVDCSELVRAFNRVTGYAHKAGTTIIASNGNDGRHTNFDGSVTTLPGGANHVISVSATSPYEWGINSMTDLDIRSSYSTYGSNGTDLAGPGGDFDLFFDNGGATCTGYVLFDRPCYAYDMVFSTVAGGWAWFAGTSMAAPHVSGVAAIIIGKNGGDMAPVDVYKALRSSADDLGKPGKDDDYGHGRVNAYNAVVD